MLCGSRGFLNAHHIKRKHDYPELTYVIENGITLCGTCHGIVTGHEVYFQPLFERINNMTLTINYMMDFFEWTSKHMHGIVKSLKKYDKWEKIPVNLVKLVMLFESKKNNGYDEIKRKHTKQKATAISKSI